MLAQVVLTTAESKKLIARAVMQLPEMQHALSEGIVVLHPSSTTYFIYEQITTMRPTTTWVYGLITPDGACRSRSAVDELSATVPPRKQWIFERGVLQDQYSLEDILERMGEDDIYVKACNAVDTDGHAAVLTSTPDRGGTVGKVLKAQRRRGFSMLLPTGLEKLVPTKVSILRERLGEAKADCGGGLALGVFLVDGQLLDERSALKILCGVDALAAAGGGLCGAEGAVTLFVEADAAAVNRVMETIDAVKGACLPQLEYVVY